MTADLSSFATYMQHQMFEVQTLIYLQLPWTLIVVNTLCDENGQLLLVHHTHVVPYIGTFCSPGRGLVPWLMTPSGDQPFLSHSQVTDQVSLYIPARGNCIS